MTNKYNKVNKYILFLNGRKLNNIFYKKLSPIYYSVLYLDTIDLSSVICSLIQCINISIYQEKLESQPAIRLLSRINN